MKRLDADVRTIREAAKISQSQFAKLIGVNLRTLQNREQQRTQPTGPAKSAFAKQMRSSKTFAFNHIARTYQTQIINIIQQMKPGETWDEASERMRKRFDGLEKRRLVKAGLNEIRRPSLQNSTIAFQIQ